VVQSIRFSFIAKF